MSDAEPDAKGDAEGESEPDTKLRAQTLSDQVS